MNIRKNIFWILDKIRNNNIRCNYNDIDFIIRYRNKIKTNKLLENRLEMILKNAVETTVYYSKYNKNDLKSFPLINKNIIKKHVNDFISKEYKESQLVTAMTSGSTGTPFRVFMNKEKKQRNTADTIYFAKLGGYDIGGKLFYLKIWRDDNKKSWLQLLSENIVPIDVLNLSENADKVLGLIIKNRNAISFLGYVSAFETLTSYIEKNKIDVSRVNVKSFITMSEGITDYLKGKGEYYFKCPVLSRYSNIENGIIAQQTLFDTNNFLINSASYLVEIFKIDKDEIADDQELGRIVVTDYYNFGMPLIRYDTGDLGIKCTIRINGIIHEGLKRIEGRKLDQIYNTKGQLISSYIVYKNMWQYPEIDQYQLIQENKNKYTFKINAPLCFEKEDKLVAEFKSYLGGNADFKVEYVNEIPLLDSGKRKKVVNLMNKIN